MMTDQQFTPLAQRYMDTIFRLAFHYTKSQAEADDITQEVLFKLYRADKEFESEDHVKCWLLRVTINACKDLLKSFFRSRVVSLEEAGEHGVPPSGTSDVLEAVLRLPEKYRQVIYLHYYEGYTAPEIGRILGRNVNTVYTLMTRARQMLRQALGGEELAE